MPSPLKLAPCLWFDDQAEAAVDFYIGIFPNSRITQVARYGEAGREFHRREPGSVMTIAFELDGHPFTALNGGPLYTFTEAISFQVECETQAEIDHYWDSLGAGGDEKARQCGWLKDRFGVSWQIVPAVIAEWTSDPDPARSQRVVEAMMPMKKLDIAALKRAYTG